MPERIKQFIEKEHITFFALCNPFFVFRLLSHHRYIHFFLIGVTGVGINLVLTWFFAEFVFGRSRYFDAYLIGLAGNLVYNFILHTVITFKTTRAHSKRFIVFIFYALLMTALQAYLVKIITPIVGVDYYLFVIASIILFFSTVSFFIFKLSVFNEKINENTPA
jgi:putative flippase GtrA